MKKTGVTRSNLMKDRVRVIIVDDHPLFRAGLRQVIAADSRFELIAETEDGNAALELIQKQKPEVAVIDINLPGLSGLEIARRLHFLRGPTRLIILTMHKEEETVNRALDFGVSGFVLKENAEEEILKALVAVSGGAHYLSPTISGYLVRRRQQAQTLAAQKPGIDSLTKAELRILRLISQKKTSREIATELFISPRTVEAHRANISAKLGLHGSHSLLQFALENRSALGA